MRTHELLNLRIRGRDAVLAALPNFDFYGLKQVRALRVLPRKGAPDRFDLNLEIVYAAGGGQHLVSLGFAQISKATLPDFSPSFYFSELEIEDLSGDQLEGIRYHAVDYGSRFEVYANDLEIALLAP